MLFVQLQYLSKGSKIHLRNNFLLSAIIWLLSYSNFWIEDTEWLNFIPVRVLDLSAVIAIALCDFINEHIHIAFFAFRNATTPFINDVSSGL